MVERGLIAGNTARAYHADWEDFSVWCERLGYRDLPASAETIALYLRSQHDAGKAFSTVRRRLAAIAHAHQARGLPSPSGEALVRDVLADLRRVDDLATGSKAPISPTDLRRMLDILPASITGTRDRALLLIGYAGRLRRSELVSIDVENLVISSQGDSGALELHKDDQVDRVIRLVPGRRLGGEAVEATRRWLDEAEIESGPLFRRVNRHGQVGDERISDKTVALAVKRAAASAGLDAALYAGESLRA